MKDRNWTAGDENGQCPTWERVQLAVLMDLRDELKESKRLHRETLDSINAIRHFVHALGGEKIKLLIREHHRTASLKLQRRRRAQAAARRKSRA